MSGLHQEKGQHEFWPIMIISQRGLPRLRDPRHTEDVRKTGTYRIYCESGRFIRFPCDPKSYNTAPRIL